MKLEKHKTNHGIMLRGPYKDGTAYIGRFYDTPYCNELVDWIVENYPPNPTLEGARKSPRPSA